MLEALQRVPNAKVRLDVHGLRQAGSENYTAQLENAAVGDPRLRSDRPFPPDGVIAAMRVCDLVVVPSRILETGPLVVLKSFAAGIPVLGDRLGGSRQLVADGIDGVLIKPDNSATWSSPLGELLRKSGAGVANSGLASARRGG